MTDKKLANKLQEVVQTWLELYDNLEPQDEDKIIPQKEWDILTAMLINVFRNYGL